MTAVYLRTSGLVGSPLTGRKGADGGLGGVGVPEPGAAARPRGGAAGGRPPPGGG